MSKMKRAKKLVGCILRDPGYSDALDGRFDFEVLGVEFAENYKVGRGVVSCLCFKVRFLANPTGEHLITVNSRVKYILVGYAVPR